MSVSSVAEPDSTTKRPSGSGPSPVALIAAALFGAGCMLLAYPSLSWAWPVLLAFPPLLLLTRHAAWKRRLWAGWLMGFSYHLVLFEWVGSTLAVMTNMPSAATTGALVVFALWHGLMAGVFLALAEPIRRAAEHLCPGCGPLAIAATYVAIEWVWPMIFTLSIGHTFWEVTPIAAVQALTGVPGPTFLIILVGAIAVELRVGPARRLWISGVTVLALVSFGFGWLAHVNGAEPHRILKVAVIQPNYTLEEKRNGSRAVRLDHLKRITERIRRVPRGSVDLIVGPEGGFPLRWVVDADKQPADKVSRNLKATRAVQRAVREGPGVDLIMGGLRNHGDETRNAAVHIGANGRIVDWYDKRTLVPFSEYLPGRDLFPSLRDAIKGIGDFRPGDKPCQFTVANVKLGCGICYESIFAHGTRADIADASLLLNFTIDTWFGESTARALHLIVQTPRAVELGIPLIRSTLDGISAHIGPDGQLKSHLDVHADEIMTLNVPLVDLTPPYRAIGPIFLWLCVGSVLVLVVFARRRRRELFGGDEVLQAHTKPEASSAG